MTTTAAESSMSSTTHRFHQRCGRRITLANGGRTAMRSVRDFSNALVFSEEPLQDDVLFEVVIDKKNHSWGGSIEIGVTSESPEKIELPSCATAMHNGTWVMSGLDVRKDGVCLVECYGTDLETLNERDRVGVMCTSNNELIFFVNGDSMGVAARNMPKPLWALVDLYGRCVQISICSNAGAASSVAAGSSNFYESCLQQTQQIVQNIDVPMSVDVTVSASPSVPSLFNSPSGTSLDMASLSLFSAAANSIIASLPHCSAVGNSNNNNNNNNSSSSSNSTRSALLNISDMYGLSDRLRFHTRCGSLVKLSPNCRSAERRRPLDEFNNGVVMTHRPLKDNELFEIRIDKLVDKWSGSIEVGVTTHNPTVLHFPATMTNMRSGTIMMSGCGILTNGKGTRRQYGEFNLDELRENDRVGMMRKSNGNLHYYINGQDQGVAATRVATTLWGVIDLYGMTIKVTIVDRDDRELQNLVTRRMNTITSDRDERDQQNLVTRRMNLMMTDSETSIGGTSVNSSTYTPAFGLHSPEPDATSTSSAAATSANEERLEDRLTFHPLCGSHATVTNSGRTALRPNASDDFNNGVVLTRRPLRCNELFQVRLERVVAKWAGSVEMGVTIHSAEELDFPFTMTNVRSGTWMMTGNGVMHNGVTVIEQYGQNLDRLIVGDRVGVVRKDDGTLHFWVNGVDQGVAATNVPEYVFGVIDLYGQAAQASIIDTSECESPDTGNSTISNTTLYSEPPLRFHALHGKNVCLTNCGLTASRPNSLAEFNDAVLFTNRPLRQKELFEVTIDAMVRHWSGNIEIGVTGTRPDDIKIGFNATDLESNETIILCGSMVFLNRKTMRSNVLVDLDTLQTGTRVGVMRNDDFLHLFLDGTDHGPVCECRFQNIWGVIDLYGQCAQVTLVPHIEQQHELRAPYATSENSQSCQATSVIQPATLDAKHRWTCVAGNALLSQNYTVATRIMSPTAALSHSVVFSENPLTVGTPFEIKIVSRNPVFAGSLNIGVTDLNLADEYVRRNIPLGINRIPANVWYLAGNEVRLNSKVLQRSLTSLDWLRVGDRIALELTPARGLRILINSEDMNIHFDNVFNDLYAVVELMGSTMAVQVISAQGPSSPLRPCSLRLHDSLEFAVDPLNKQDSFNESEVQGFEFCEVYGKNIKIAVERNSASRIQSYNHGLVFVNKPLCKGESITLKIDAINNKWKGTMGLGVIGACPQPGSANQLPASILQCKRPCWVATHDFININGHKTASLYGAALEEIQQGTTVTMTLSHTGMLIITVGKHNLEDLAIGLPNNVYAVFDIYGKCEQITIINSNECAPNATAILDTQLIPTEQDAIQQQQQQPTQQQQQQTQVKQLPQPQQQQDVEQQNELCVENRAVVTVQREKADLEVNEKHSDLNVQIPNRTENTTTAENQTLNTSIKNRCLEQSRLDVSASTSSACCLRESLQQQHNTNLNIQRSQSTQRLLSTSINNNDTANAAIAAVAAMSSNIAVASTSAAALAHLNDTNKEQDALAEEPFTNNESIGALINLETDTNLFEDFASFDGKDTNNFEDELLPRSSNFVFSPVDGSNLLSSNEPANNTDASAEEEQMSGNNPMISTAASSQDESEVELECQYLSTRSRHFQLGNIADNNASFNLQQSQDPPSMDNNSVTSGQFDSLTSIPSIERKDCEYMRLVQRFRASLVLPRIFFQQQHEPVCFCVHCNAQLSDKLNGWVYFKLNQKAVNSTATQRVVNTGDWLPLFYNTRVEKIRATLDYGQPLPMESSYEALAAHYNQKDEPGIRLELHMSPNSFSVNTNAHHTFQDSGNTYYIGTAFEVYVRRQSLCASLCCSKTNSTANTSLPEAKTAAKTATDTENETEVTEASSQSTNVAATTVQNETNDMFSANAESPDETAEPMASCSNDSSTSSLLKDMTYFTKEANACIITALMLKLEKAPTKPTEPHQPHSYTPPLHAKFEYPRI